MTTTNPSKYDPAYCLAEHLNYFSENVASNLANDFDVVFDSPKSLYQSVLPKKPALPVKHIFIEKVIILPKNFVLPPLVKPTVAPFTPTATTNTPILPYPVTSDPLKTKPQNNAVPASPTSVVKAIQMPQIPIPGEVPNPMLAVSQVEASKAMGESTLPVPVISAAAAPATKANSHSVSSDSSISSASAQDDPVKAAPASTTEDPLKNACETTGVKESTLPSSSPQTVQSIVPDTPSITPVVVAPSPMTAPPPPPSSQPTTTDTRAAAEPPAAVQSSAVVSDSDEDKEQAATRPNEEPLTNTPATRKRRSSSDPVPGDVRRERNRKHAKKSRQRKKEYNQNLQESINALKAENDWLRSKLDITTTESSQEAAKEDEGGLLPAEGEQCDDDKLDLGDHDAFLSALQNPENRIIGDDALTALQDLIQFRS